MRYSYPHFKDKKLETQGVKLLNEDQKAHRKNVTFVPELPRHDWPM